MKSTFRIKVNGEDRMGEAEDRMLLVHFIRDVLGLTGTHVGCDTSSCGACAVILDGRAVKSCTVFAAQADGSQVTTVEGISQNGNLHPLQEAFWEDHALQCGFCTPGMLISAYELLGKNPQPTDNEIAQAISGNLCRCTGYVNIVKAIRDASIQMKEEGKMIKNMPASKK
jgi:carbon-monoxide dehydrogenase small subunit